MSTGERSGPIHPEPTRRSGYRYLFHDKHHGHDPSAARWLPELNQDEEFAVFDASDFHDLSDDRGWLYGVRIGPEGEVLELGTWSQQVAEFPCARFNDPWHGYPLWPLKEAGPANRRGEEQRPSKAVFLKMEETKVLTRRDRKRLMKGDFV
jgi:hypothetical protein